MMPRGSDVRLTLRVVSVILVVAGGLALIWLLRHPIGWMVMALFVAVAISSPVNRLSRRMRRGAAITISYIGLLLAPLALIAVVTPSIVGGAEDLTQELPDYVQQLTERVRDNERLNELDQQYGVTERLQEEARALPGRLGDAASILTDLGIQIVNSIFAAVTILILSIFMVASGRRWIDGGLALMPEDRAVRLRRALDNSARAIGAYVRGVLLQATIAGFCTWIVLLLLGVPFAAPLAVIVGLLDAIPLIGATIGGVIVLVVTLFVDFPTATIIWAIWAVIYQQLENSVIQPRIQSRAVNVNAFVIIVSVLFGGTLFGVVGALLAVPVAASIQILGTEWLDYRRDARAEHIMSTEVRTSAPEVVLPDTAPGTHRA